MTHQLTIITINYNNAIGLQKTMESIVGQTNTNFEYIIIDGGSTDDSIEKVKAIAENFPLQYISERDNGIYDAMNKGIKIAKGEYLLFLNSGDWLYDAHVIENFYKHYDVSAFVLSGDAMLLNGDAIKLKKHIEQVDFNYLLINDLCHQATFIKRSTFQDYGFYDLAFKIVADWVHVQKVIGIHQLKYVQLPFTVCYYDMSGISSSTTNRNALLDEKRNGLKKILPEHIYPTILEAFNNYHDSKHYLYKKVKTLEKKEFFKTLMRLSLLPTFVINTISLRLKKMRRN